MAMDYVWKEEALRKNDHCLFDYIQYDQMLFFFFFCIFCNGPKTFLHNLPICVTTKLCL